MPFYVRDLSICRLWYLQGVLEPVLTDSDNIACVPGKVDTKPLIKDKNPLIQILGKLII
jgi:hypothetical protein